MGIKDEIAAVQVESEAHRELPDDARGRRRTRSTVHSLRLSRDDSDAIAQLAHQLGVPVGALIRGWVLEGLAREQSETVRSAVERLIADADRLRRLTA